MNDARGSGRVAQFNRNRRLGGTQRREVVRAQAALGPEHPFRTKNERKKSAA
jgi:hypothetical protein